MDDVIKNALPPVFTDPVESLAYESIRAALNDACDTFDNTGDYESAAQCCQALIDLRVLVRKLRVS